MESPHALLEFDIVLPSDPAVIAAHARDVLLRGDYASVKLCALGSSDDRLVTGDDMCDLYARDAEVGEWVDHHGKIKARCRCPGSGCEAVGGGGWWWL